MNTIYLQFSLTLGDTEYEVGGNYELDDNGAFWEFTITSIKLNGKELEDTAFTDEDSFTFQTRSEPAAVKAFAALQVKDREDYLSEQQGF